MTQGLGRMKSAARRKNPGTNKHVKSVTGQIDSIIKEADIILEVLDARFIDKSRNPELEEKVKRQGKVIIYILNKSDLVDVNELKRTVELEQVRPYIFFSSKDRKGSLSLRRLIKINAEKTKKDSVSVGVIGYPNSGKSSLINYLVGKSSARVSSQAGYTKGIQKLKLSKGLYLIDTPGIIPPQEKIQSTEEILVKLPKIGATTWDKTKNPDMVVASLVRQYPKILEDFYKVNAKGNSEFLIEELGKKLGYLKKGGLVDEDRTAKKILRDWQEGKISYFKKFGDE